MRMHTHKRFLFFRAGVYNIIYSAVLARVLPRRVGPELADQGYVRKQYSPAQACKSRSDVLLKDFARGTNVFGKI